MKPLEKFRKEQLGSAKVLLSYTITLLNAVCLLMISYKHNPVCSEHRFKVIPFSQHWDKPSCTALAWLCIHRSCRNHAAKRNVKWKYQSQISTFWVGTIMWKGYYSIFYQNACLETVPTPFLIVMCTSWYHVLNIPLVSETNAILRCRLSCSLLLSLSLTMLFLILFLYTMPF